VRERAIEHGATYASDPLRLREARRWMSRLVLAAGFAPSAVHDLAVAFSEAAANVHRHAYAGRHDGRVALRVTIDDACVVLTLEHDGAPFDPSSYRPPDLKRATEGGYGVYLISSLVDEVSFRRTPTGGSIVLVKHRVRASLHAESKT
jgi:anti-sigma regulatory factor (Ser/Thr protein kinase)